MSYQTLRFKITGVSPLVVHNGQLIDPLNPWSNSIAELTKKRAKTESDLIEIARREFLGSLYIGDGRPCLPGEMLEAALVAGAKKSKEGVNARAGILVEKNARLDYPGPAEPLHLWEDTAFRLTVPVKIGQNRVMRTRPIFRSWSAEIEVGFLPSLVNASAVRRWLDVCGLQIGLGDWRPRFGRFVAEAL